MLLIDLLIHERVIDRKIRDARTIKKLFFALTNIQPRAIAVVLNVRYNEWLEMKLSIVYIILALSFGILFVVSVPRTGCYGAVCSDFQSVGVITFIFYGLALLFSILGLLRLLKKVKLNQLHKYDSKDLNNLDG